MAQLHLIPKNRIDLTVGRSPLLNVLFAYMDPEDRMIYIPCISLFYIKQIAEYVEEMKIVDGDLIVFEDIDATYIWDATEGQCIILIDRLINFTELSVQTTPDSYRNIDLILTFRIKADQLSEIAKSPDNNSFSCRFRDVEMIVHRPTNTSIQAFDTYFNALVNPRNGENIDLTLDRKRKDGVIRYTATVGPLFYFHNEVEEHDYSFPVEYWEGWMDYFN